MKEYSRQREQVKVSEAEASLAGLRNSRRTMQMEKTVRGRGLEMYSEALGDKRQTTEAPRSHFTWVLL